MKPLPTALILALAGFALGGALFSADSESRAKEIAKSFAPFSPSVKTRHDEKMFFVESNGIPDHELMVGIVAWQQQVPIAQPYVGENAWSFPLNPTPAKEPMSSKTGFFRGAIALAANGVPIFNPIKNDGRTDTLIAGELDNFGGHCGRGDDYHYHIAPLHLVAKLGPALPIAYALDGYPLFGLTCPDAKSVADLDALNGHTTPKLGYHYHATKRYPYLNGGFHGEVVERDGQVAPQPRADGIRPALPPLRGAKITAFKTLESKKWELTYEVRGESHKVRYALEAGGAYRFEFIAPDGTIRTETYRSQRQPGGRGGNRGGGGLPPAPTDAPRKPWLLEHIKEIDTNGDKLATLVELNELIRAAWTAVAGTENSVKVDAVKTRPTARNVIGGYLKGHAAEFDENNDGSITLQEVLDEFARLLHKADKNHDHAISEDEGK